MNMVEKVARAICAEHGYRDPYIDTTWQKYVPHARCAIVAMREPTEKMLDAGEKHVRLGRIVKEKYRWMIDAALSE